MLRNTIVTGHPRFHLLNSDYKALYSDDENKYLDSYGEFVLINTNFGLGNNLRPRSSVEETYGSRFPQLDQLIEYQAKQVQNFASLAIAIKQATPFNVVIRPHPEESTRPYADRVRNHDGIFIEQRGSAIPAILAARAMIHHDCTTALECAMLGRDSIAYIPNHEPSLTTEIPLRISLVAETESQVVSLLGQDLTLGEYINFPILERFFNFPSDSGSIISEDIRRQVTAAKRAMLGSIAFRIGNVASRLKTKLRGGKDQLSEPKLEGLSLVSCMKVARTLAGAGFVESEISEIAPHLFKFKAR